MKKNKSKNNHISNTVQSSKSKIKLSFSGSEYIIVKSNHLYDERTESKQRDQFIDDSRYKQIAKLALIN